MEMVRRAASAKAKTGEQKGRSETAAKNTREDDDA